MGCAPVQVDWTHWQHSLLAAAQGSFNVIYRLLSLLGIEIDRKWIFKKKTQQKTPKQNKATKNPNPNPKAYSDHLKQMQLSSGVIQCKGKGPAPFMHPLHWHWSELTWVFVAVLMPGAADPVYRCEFQLCPLLKGGFSCWAGLDRKQINKKSSLLCLECAPAFPLSFAALFISSINVGSFCFIQCFFLLYILGQIYEIVFLVHASKEKAIRKVRLLELYSGL